jgi:hypothetical protein
MEKFKQLESVIAEMKDDVTKCYEKGNNAAGVRVRKALQTVKELSQEIRKEVSEQKKESKKV